MTHQVDVAKFDSISPESIKNKDILDIVLPVFLTLITLFFSNNSVLCLIVTVIFLFYSVAKGEEYSLAFILFGVSNSKLLNIGGASASVLICVLYVFLAFTKKKKLSISIALLSFAYVLFCSQYFIRYGDFSSSFIMPIKMVFVILYFYFFVTNEKIVRKKNRVLLISILYGSIGIIVNLLTSYLLKGASGRASVIDNDPNMLAIEAATMLMFIMVFYMKYKWISLKSFTILSLLLGLSIVLTGSRNGFVLLALTFVFSIVLNIKKTLKSIFLYIVLAAIVCFIIFTDVGKGIISTLLFRSEVQLNNTGSIFGERSTIWKQYIDALNSSSRNWFLGFGNYTNVGLNMQAHNFLLEGVSGNGIIGISLLIITFFVVFKEYKKRVNVKFSLYCLTPAIIVVVGGITLHSLVSLINLSMIFSTLLLFDQKELPLKCLKGE